MIRVLTTIFFIVIVQALLTFSTDSRANETAVCLRSAPPELRQLKESVAQDQGARFISVNGHLTVVPSKALKHIVFGDFSEKPIPMVVAGKSKNQAVKVLSGGLHTKGALENFLRARPDIVDISQSTDGTRKGSWTQTITLDNGVMRVRLPENAYTADALRNTFGAELQGSSGYGWKTLFPESMKEHDILAAIEQVLASPTKVEATKRGSYVYGIAKLENGAEISITVALGKNNEVGSAYPNWEQPKVDHLGDRNNFEAGYASTVYNPVSHDIPKDVFWKDLDQLVDDTPRVLLDFEESVEFKMAEEGEEWGTNKSKARSIAKTMSEWAEKATPSEVDELKRYLLDPRIVVNPIAADRSIRSIFRAEIDVRLPEQKHHRHDEAARSVASQIGDNLRLGNSLLREYDKIHGTGNSLDVGIETIRARLAVRNKRSRQYDDFLDLYENAAIAANNAQDFALVGKYFEVLSDSHGIAYFIASPKSAGNLEKLLLRCAEFDRKLLPNAAVLQRLINAYVQTVIDPQLLKSNDKFLREMLPHPRDAARVAAAAKKYFSSIGDQKRADFARELESKIRRYQTENALKRR